MFPVGPITNSLFVVASHDENFLLGNCVTKLSTPNSLAYIIKSSLLSSKLVPSNTSASPLQYSLISAIYILIMTAGKLSSLMMIRKAFIPGKIQTFAEAAFTLQ